MTKQEIDILLTNSEHPVARVFHTGEHFKVLMMGFKQGMILKEHTAKLPTKLLLIQGKMIYKEGDKNVLLNCFEETEIPVGIAHSIEALEDSFCILTQG